MSAVAHRHIFTASVLALGIGILAGCEALRHAEGQAAVEPELIERAPSAAGRGAARFVYGDFGHLSSDTLQTQAVPWKLVSAALVLNYHRVADGDEAHRLLRVELERFGFLYPVDIANWDGPVPTGPLGMVRGMVSNDLVGFRVDTATLGCASCHAGRLYDAHGQATRSAWLGAPNTSLDLDAYGNAVYTSLAGGVRREGELLALVDRMYPDMSAEERDSLVRYVLPALRSRLDGIASDRNRALPFLNGGPGTTNGVAALKRRLGVANSASFENDRGFTSIPDLGGFGLRSSLLYDGLYYPPDGDPFRPLTAANATPELRRAIAYIPAYFTISTQGGTVESASRAISRMVDVAAFVTQYRSAEFPGTVDARLAERGARLYREHCSSCHGSYDDSRGRPRLVQFPNRPVPISVVGTDDARLTSVTPELVATINNSSMGKYLRAERRTGYVAPALDGIWLTAPYLHNGSVPTLRALLFPETRPAEFYRAYDVYDWADVGFVSSGPDAQREGVRFDTRERGNANTGHTYGQELTADQREDLLEYLKTL